MEAIKISVDVRVDLSENTQNFIKCLFAQHCGCGAPTQVVAVDNFDPSQEDFSQVSKSPAPSAPAPSAPAPSASKSIEDVRKALAEKVNEHRAVIKEKLSELGAPSVTKLDQSKYDEMYNFLKSL